MALFLLLLATAFAVRARPLAYFSGEDGAPILRADDSQYHARRARYSLENFPAVLVRDSYLEYPTGADVVWPPLWDWSLAAVASALGGGAERLSRVLAWAPVVVGTLTLVPVALAVRALASPAVALGAAALLAVLPAALMYTSFGNADHHAAVAFEGALLLAGFCLALRRGTRMRLQVFAHVLLAGGRAALVLTWQGSLLYLAVGEPLFLAIAGLAGRQRALAAYGWGAFGSAALVAPWVAQAAGPDARWLGSQLSWLHVLALGAVGASALVLAAWERARPVGWLLRAGRLLLVGAGALAAILLAVGGLQPLGVAAGYLGREQPWVARNFESVPIYAGGSTDVARRLFAGIAFVLPALPLAALWRARLPELREPALFLCGWSAAFVGLSVSSARFAGDFAPAAAACSALLLADAPRLAAARGVLPSRLAPAAALALGVALVGPALARIAVGMPHAVETLRHGATRSRLGEAAFHHDLLSFARAVREATPPTAGYLDGGRPEYGILCLPAMGLALLNTAERPVTATGFGPYLGGWSFDASLRFYGLRSEPEATALARRLGARYVATSLEGRPPPDSLLHRLQVGDGRAEGTRPALAHFRLVTEAPVRGVPLGFASGTARRSEAPYKLFEVVPGAVLEHRGRPRGRLRAEVEIRTPGRRFVYVADARADASGVARVRVPYATDATGPVRPAGPYLVTTDGATRRVSVSDAQVLGGQVIQVGG